jgi:hypothetical protein
MPERPGLLINRAGTVAWCTEKRGMPSLPCAMGGSCWLRTAFAVRRGLPACQLMGKLEAREEWENGWFYIGNGGWGSEWQLLLGSAVTRLTIVLPPSHRRCHGATALSSWSDVCDIAPNSSLDDWGGMGPYPTSCCRRLLTCGAGNGADRVNSMLRFLNRTVCNADYLTTHGRACGIGELVIID